MKQLKPYTHLQKSFIFLAFALFSLSPCTVKEAALGVFNIDFEKPINKNKIQNPEQNNCISIDLQEDVFTLEANKKTKPFIFLESPRFVFISKENFFKNFFSKELKAHSFRLPLFIIYQSLKLDF